MDQQSSASGEQTTNGRPGTEGIWTFVFLDMLVFALLFLVYLSERARLPEIFGESRRHLDPLVGLVSTMALLTGSWCMAEAVRAIRAARQRRAATFMTLALSFGMLFVANKLIEYAGKISGGITPATNSFFTFYFAITGLHFAHVVGGLAFMVSLRLRIGREGGTARYLANAENVGLFWHFVDVLWLLIFPLLYLAGVAR